MEPSQEKSLLLDEKKLYIFNEKENDAYFKSKPWETE